MQNNTLQVIWSDSLSEIETFFNYSFSEKVKEEVKNKLIKVCSKQCNNSLDEEMLTLCFTPFENQNFKYNESINISLKGESKLYKLWEYSNINYTMIVGGNEI